MTLPVYTRLLGTEDFGRYELLTSIIALLYAVCLLGLDFAISVRYFGSSEGDRRRDVASAIGAAALASIVAAGVLGALAGMLGPIVLQSPSGGLAFAVAIAAVPFNVLGGVLAMYLRLRFRGFALFRAMLGGAVGGTSSGLILVSAAHLGLVGAVIGLTVVHVLSFCLLAVGVRGLLHPAAADRPAAIRLVRLGAPLVPAGAASWIFALADRFFVAALLGFGQLGMYAAAARLATILALLQFGFHAAWGPLALRWGGLPDRDDRYAASLRLVATAGGASVAVLAWLARPLLELLAGPDYVAASDAVWLLASGVLFSAMFYVVQIGSSIAQRGGAIAWTLITAAVANTVGNVVLIPMLGYVGAGVATVATYFVAYVMMYTMSQRVTPIAMRFGRATAVAASWMLVAAGSTFVPSTVRPSVGVLVVVVAVAIGLAAIARSVSVLAPVPVGGPAGDDSEVGPAPPASSP